MASEDLYEIERILDKRKSNKGKTEYLVQWKGYGREDATWEPEQHLVNCEECMHDFNHCHSEKHVSTCIRIVPFLLLLLFVWVFYRSCQ